MPRSVEEKEVPIIEEPNKQQKADIEKLEEQKLKSKFPGMSARPAGGGGHSSFLQKRLAKGAKYFDSGDYQMAKQKGRLGMGRLAVQPLAQSTGEAHPTPDTVPARKTSIIQPLHDHSHFMQHVASDPAHQPPAVLPGQPMRNPALANL